MLKCIKFIYITFTLCKAVVAVIKKYDRIQLEVDIAAMAGAKGTTLASIILYYIYRKYKLINNLLSLYIRIYRRIPTAHI